MESDYKHLNTGAIEKHLDRQELARHHKREAMQRQIELVGDGTRFTPNLDLAPE
jgi:hypothetical protein